MRRISDQFDEVSTAKLTLSEAGMFFSYAFARPGTFYERNQNMRTARRLVLEQRTTRISFWTLGMPEAKKMTAKRATPPNMPALMPLGTG